MEIMSQGQTARVVGNDAFATMLKVLSREVEAEILEKRPAFFGFHDPEEGDIGCVRDVHVLTPRGETLQVALALFEHVVEMRQVLRDRLDVRASLPDWG